MKTYLTILFVAVNISLGCSKKSAVPPQPEVTIQAPTGPVATVAIDISKTHQKIVGFGSHGWVDDRTLQLDPAFYRIVVDKEYAGELEEAANDNNDPNVLDESKFLWSPDHINWAKKVYALPNPPFFIATIFSPPVWMKDMSSSPYSIYGLGGTEVLPSWSPCNYAATRYLCGGKLKPEMREEFAEWITGWLKEWKKRTGKEIYSISIQNEPEFHEPYGSLVYSPSELAITADVVAKRFKKDGLTTKMFLGEILWAQNNVLKFYEEMVKYPDLMERLDAFALHNYDTDGIKVGGASATQWANTYQFAATHKKEMWMSETSGHKNDLTDEGLMGYCGALYNALYYGNINLWCYLTNSPDDTGLQNWQAIKVTNKIKANSIRCDAISDNSDILSLGFSNFNNQTLSVMLINRGETEKSVKLTSAVLPNEMDVFTTTTGKSAVLLGKLNKANNYTITLPAKSHNVATGLASIPVSVAK